MSPYYQRLPILRFQTTEGHRAHTARHRTRVWRSRPQRRESTTCQYARDHPHPDPHAATPRFRPGLSVPLKPAPPVRNKSPDLLRRVGCGHARSAESPTGCHPERPGRTPHLRRDAHTTHTGLRSDRSGPRRSRTSVPSWRPPGSFILRPSKRCRCNSDTGFQCDTRSPDRRDLGQGPCPVSIEDKPRIPLSGHPATQPPLNRATGSLPAVGGGRSGGRRLLSLRRPQRRGR